jgi:shikimate kinase
LHIGAIPYKAPLTDKKRHLRVAFFCAGQRCCYAHGMSARPHSNIFLIGPMGSGKSAVGRRLAHELALGFHDSDEEVEARTGVDIPYIFEKEGEEGFRRREATAIGELVTLDGVVLATGGGAALDPANRQLLVEHGTVVYLHTSVPEQIRRTRKSRNRPLLNDGDPGEVLEQLMAVRDPLYREIADLVIETDGRQVAAVTREIVKALKDD